MQRSQIVEVTTPGGPVKISRSRPVFINAATVESANATLVYSSEFKVGQGDAMCAGSVEQAYTLGDVPLHTTHAVHESFAVEIGAHGLPVDDRSFLEALACFVFVLAFDRKLTEDAKVHESEHSKHAVIGRFWCRRDHPFVHRNSSFIIVLKLCIIVAAHCTKKELLVHVAFFSVFVALVYLFERPPVITWNSLGFSQPIFINFLPGEHIIVFEIFVYLIRNKGENFLFSFFSSFDEIPNLFHLLSTKA
mmetsp:Transcript_9037/g.13111  ORF Transcript_9037/g.13111 Transcript_9037/m.13111 type:complete len:249 (+) Transcript_9037:817-1563(+)